MIALLSGKLIRKNETSVVLDCHGVGYLVAVSSLTLSRLPEVGGSATLEIHTHVREDALALFGFFDEQEKAVFELLLGVSGVGPKMAMNILSGLPANALVQALANEDLATLTHIPGVGKKTAERLIVELKGAVKKLMHQVRLVDLPTHRGRGPELLSALVNLGYRAQQVEPLVQKVVNEFPEAPLEVVLRECLGRLRTG